MLKYKNTRLEAAQPGEKLWKEVDGPFGII